MGRRQRQRKPVKVPTLHIRKTPIKMEMMKQAPREMGASTEGAPTIPPAKRNHKYGL